MCAAGLEYSSPSSPEITGLCETPTPRVNRPPQKLWTVAASCAMTNGCRG